MRLKRIVHKIYRHIEANVNTNFGILTLKKISNQSSMAKNNVDFPWIVGTFNIIINVTVPMPTLFFKEKSNEIEIIALKI